MSAGPPGSPNYANMVAEPGAGSRVGDEFGNMTDGSGNSETPSFETERDQGPPSRRFAASTSLDEPIPIPAQGQSASERDESSRRGTGITLDPDRGRSGGNVSHSGVRNSSPARSTISVSRRAGGAPSSPRAQIPSGTLPVPEAGPQVFGHAGPFGETLFRCWPPRPSHA